MLLSEDEAKTKRCQESFPAAANLSPDGASYATSWHYPPPPMPMAGNWDHHSAGFHPSAGAYGTAVPTAPSNCIGSACMAWRWHHREADASYETTVTKSGIPTHGKDWEMVESKPGSSIEWRRMTKPAQPARGYCGKAGPLYRSDM